MPKFKGSVGIRYFTADGGSGSQLLIINEPIRATRMVIAVRRAVDRAIQGLEEGDTQPECDQVNLELMEESDVSPDVSQG